MSCAHSEALTRELRALAVAALDRVGPLVDAARTGEGGTPSSCASCPVCALLAVLRGERPELAARLAEHAAGLLTVLRALVEELPDPAAEGTAGSAAGRGSEEASGHGTTPDGPGDPGDAGDERRRARPGPSRRVQHIRVVRA
ncbi:hypothetical protein GCM10010472_62790 [Pseudonocardia halophobica]|uniref:Uncharacterized protein n=1 Tax=Pseudonocardia halophobica TaxID=29401 RepID=A0A9W6L232_9PSEU|nr:hypothetical protein [Pseudonocardia halophobica]GLL10761.1 hypothetical protein GCM10017577_19010 [Pseudonocardia halophobica]